MQNVTHCLPSASIRFHFPTRWLVNKMTRTINVLVILSLLISLMPVQSVSSATQPDNKKGSLSAAAADTTDHQRSINAHRPEIIRPKPRIGAKFPKLSQIDIPLHFPFAQNATFHKNARIDTLLRSINWDQAARSLPSNSTQVTGWLQGDGDGDGCEDPNNPMPDESSASPDCDCPSGVGSSYPGASGHEGGPINTRTGVYDYSVTDLSIPTLAGTLAFKRSYSTLTTGVFTQTLGYGWKHNLDQGLIFPDQPNGKPGEILLKLGTSNRYIFNITGDGVYAPYPGVMASLTRAIIDGQTTYQVVDKTQGSYDFDAAGKLLKYTNAQGYSTNYCYAPSGLLTQVGDACGATAARYLQLSYDALGRVQSVADHAQRQVTFTYDPAGNLSSATDVMGQAWTYAYDDTPTHPPHLLTQITDPQSRIVERTEFDQQGRAVSQFDGLDNLIASLEYSTYATTITYASGVTATHSYDERKTLTLSVDPSGSNSSKSYDVNFRPTSVNDALSHTTSLTWSENGANLEQIDNADGSTTSMTYDSLNNLVSQTDPRGFLTTYTYSGTLLTSSTDALSHTTTYTYTTQADAPQPTGLLKATQDPSGQITTYTYNAFGQRLSITNALGATNYAYDTLGRLIRVTQPDGRSDWTCYDAADRVIRTVSNASGDGGTAQTNPCDAASYQPSADPNDDRISQNVYDASGRLIAVIDPQGIINRTYYDNSNHPVAVVRNLTGQGIEVATPPQRNPLFPTQNIRTDTVYDENRNAIATIDPTGKITRTYYDANNRAIAVTQNLVGQDIAVNTPPAYNSAYPDQNVSAQTVYDEVGNVIATIDPNGIIVRTYYDAVNRPVAVVRNLQGQAIEVSSPPAYNPAYPDRNVRTETRYDANGNPIAASDPGGKITRTYYDALNRPESVVENLVGQAIEVNTPPVYNPAFPDRNLLTDYVYDAAGNLIATVDPAGIVTRTYYDAYTRPQIVVRNLVGQSIDNPTPPAYDPAYPDRNVRTTTVYEENGTGKVIASIDPLGRMTRTYYDELDRPAVVVQNLSGQAVEVATPPVFDPAYPDQNLRSQTVYGPAGEVMASIASDGKITRTYFDVLQRPVIVVQNLVGQTIENPTPPTYDPAYPDRNLRTETVYDLSGAAVRTIQTTGQATHTCSDGLGRTVKTVQNPTVDNPCGDYTPDGRADHDVTTRRVYDVAGNLLASYDPAQAETVYQYDGQYRLVSQRDPLLHTVSYTYDAKGNRTTRTDANGVVTGFEYDDLGRLTAVVENYRPGFTANHEINLRTEYAYDAAGNRLTLQDALGHITQFGYDAFGRQTAESDPLGHTWQSGYDAAGRLAWAIDANHAQSGEAIVYTYDGLDRPTGLDYPGTTADVTFGYNASGQRALMQDSLGQTRWTYDDLGRTLAVTDPFSQTVSYQYDGLGRRTGLGYPDGKSVTYAYNDLNQLTQVTDWNAQTTAYTYTLSGQVAGILRPNGLASTYAYDAGGQVTGIEHRQGKQTLAYFQYEYDPNGNRTQAVEYLSGPVVEEQYVNVQDADGNPLGDVTVEAYSGGVYTGYSAVTDPDFGEAFFSLPAGAYRFRVEVEGQVYWSGSTDDCFTPNCTYRVIAVGPEPAEQPELEALTSVYTYDPLNRLTGVAYDRWFDSETYEYDAVGNRVRKNSMASDYDAANRLIQSTLNPYAWDANGNLLNDHWSDYTYDPANRLTQVESGNSGEAYRYNGLGDRLQTESANQITRFSLDLAGGLTQALAEGERTYLYGLERLAQETNAEREYFLTDALGNVRQVVDANGAIRARNFYNPYGEDLMPWMDEGVSRYGFAGEWTSPLTGQSYLRARWYASQMGRFISRDRWEGEYQIPASYNRWLYGYANPIKFVDPSGLNPCCQKSTAECARDRVDEIIQEVAPNGAEALFRMFEDNELSDLWGSASGITTQGRLNWLLDITSLAYPIIPFHTGIYFGDDSGFAEEFRDQRFYDSPWQLGKSNQVGHFLTAVGISYDLSSILIEYLTGNWKARVDLRLTIGHEKISDGNNFGPGRAIEQFNATTEQDIFLWNKAVEADARGDKTSRDDELWKILNFDQEVAFGSVPNGESSEIRYGNSLQDLRLSLKGYRFAHWVWGNQNALPVEAASWLRTNLQGR